MRESLAAVQRERHARVVTRLHLEQHCNILHGPPHWSRGAQLGDPDILGRPCWHPALTWTEPEHVVPRGRIAQAAHEVAAIGYREHAQGQRHSRATAATTSRPCGVVGVARYAEDLVEGMWAQSELGSVGTAEDDTTSGLHALYQQPTMSQH